jgi:TonB family protein
MIKNLTLLILSFLFFQSAKAQKTTDTLLYLMKDGGSLAANKKDADYFMFIMPMDSATKLSAINEYYPNGKPKLFANSVNRKYNQLSFDGSCITYYPNGHKRSIMNYHKGYAWGDIISYYPNGNLYTITKFNGKGRDSLVECRDSLGLVLAENGNGKWLEFYSDFSSEFEEGPIKDSLEEGEWKEIGKSNEQYVTVFHKGQIISSTAPGRYDFREMIFSAVEQEPVYADGGGAGFNLYLSKNIVFPAYDSRIGTQGRVIVTFVVEKDGTLSNVKALRGPSKAIEDEAVKIVSLSPPWVPGMQNDSPVRVQYTISFAFKMPTTNN